MPQATLVQTSNQSQAPNNSGDGYQIGSAPSEPQGFFGAAPTVQPTENNQTAVTRGQQAGVISTYNSTQSPSQTAANTTAEQLLAIQTGTGAQTLLAAGDLVFVNKPTSQAGLGYGNARVSSGNHLGLTFNNATASGITSTGSEVWSVVGIRGLPNLSATLSPVAVAANTTAEQQFTVTGLQAGHLVCVIKPTSQAGLDIVGCRIVSSNVVGITFANFTGSSITPTAAESYTFFGLAGLDAVSNDVLYGFNVGTIGAIGAGTVITGGSTALAGVLATDMVTGVYGPTAQATATNVAFPFRAIPTAGAMTLYFAGIGTGSTPTASEVYGIATKRLAPAAPLLNYSSTLTPVSVAANTSAEQTFTVTGLVAASPVSVNPQMALPAGLGIVGCRVSAANTLAINFVNLTAAAIVPPAGTYVVGNFQTPYPGAGNSVSQTVDPIVNSLGNLSNSMRKALAALGLIAGS